MKALLLLSLLVNAVCCLGQNPYTTGAVVADISPTKILNYRDSSSSLSSLQSNITIIDFFGTWCMPCLKALPELQTFKNKFKTDLSIILVSTETEEKLQRFISTRQPFSFPIIVDVNKEYTNAFQPPSYPYTIVLDKNLKILSITNAADLTAEILEKFIAENKTIVKEKNNTAPLKMENTPKQQSPSFTASNNVLVKLSQDFMYAAKTNEDASDYIRQLKELNYTDLVNNLKGDDDKKAFWINLYNAYTNYSLHKNPDQYKSRNKFFKNKNVEIAGKIFSLDKIEHGILRKSKIKWSLGYLNKLFPGKTEKQLRVRKLDYRIHFALNCGAKSCPPIAFYNPENLNAQLDLATNTYLSSEAVYNKETNTLQLPALISWFRRDFGGKKKVVNLLKQKGILDASVHPIIKFKKYDWSLFLNNFKQ